MKIEDVALLNRIQRDELRGKPGPPGKPGPKGDAGRSGTARVQVSATDPEPDYLAEKLVGGNWISLRRETRRGSEQLVIDAHPPGGGGGGAHPNLAAHDTMGLATDAEVTAAIAAAIAAHAATPHGSDVPAEFGFAT